MKYPYHELKIAYLNYIEVLVIYFFLIVYYISRDVVKYNLNS